MAGFFNPDNTVIVRGDEKFKKGAAHKRKTLNCDDCGLHRKCQSPYMKASGLGRKGVMVIGEAPGRIEDRKNAPFVGMSGQDLREAISRFGFIPERDIIFTNANRCRPPQNATPNLTQVEACYHYLEEEIERYKPHVIITIGENAFNTIVGRTLSGRSESTRFSSWIGEHIPNQDLGVWICPVYHPAYIARLVEEYSTPERSAPTRIWVKSLHDALALHNISVPDHSKHSDRLDITTEPSKTIKWLGELKSNVVVFDYETTGLKPHRKGHKILCASVYNGKKALSFPFFDDNDFQNAWYEFLINPNINKVAHNISFEALWSHHFSAWPVGWSGDSMLAAHVLNNLKNVGLKYLVAAKLGVGSYDEKSDPFIKASEAEEDLWGNNGFNHMKDMPLLDMLEYCGLDSIYGRVLWRHILRQLESFQLDGLDLLVRGQASLVEITENGMRLSLDALENNKLFIEDKLSDAAAAVHNCRELKKWDKADSFSPTNPEHMRHLLYDILGYKPTVFTKNDNPSASEEALIEFDIPITHTVLEYRRWHKALNTYISQFEREVIGDKIHGWFSMAGVRTFRSSSYNPALQNVSVRDEEVSDKIRGTIYPHLGNKFNGYDYKAIEVMIAAIYTQDTNLLKYVRDQSTDMHRDLCMQLYKLPIEMVTKIRRYWAKNRFVFPEFYGSYYASCAPNLWKGVEEDAELREHLRDSGIATYAQFEKHVRDVEDDFWNNRFFEYSQWKLEKIKEYHLNGYIDSLSGFRYHGFMSDRDICSYPIQGTAFHILLWSLSQIQDELKEREIVQTTICSEIHDQILGDVHPEDDEMMDYLVWKWGTQEVVKHWDWITVPLRLEKATADVDAPWSEVKDIGFLENPFEKTA